MMENITPANVPNVKVRICPVCKQEVLIKPGLQNWKSLFRKPTFDEMITLFIIIGVIAIYFAYQNDVKQYQNYIANNCSKGYIPPGGKLLTTAEYPWNGTAYVNPNLNLSNKT